MRTTRQFPRATGLFSALGLCLVALVPCASLCQEGGIDPAATKILKASTEFLAGQVRFSVDTHSTLEVVLTSGQKIQFDQAALLWVERPNKLRADRRGDLVDQVFYYDGKSLSQHNPGDMYYATVAAPGTLEEMMDFARDQLDIVAPAGDLLYQNAYDILMQDVTDGFVVGKSVVNGVHCDHLAFRTPQTDWQIWIQEGDRPLPCKLVITSKDIAGEPQVCIAMTKWDLAPKFSEALFKFTPPKGAKRVDFMAAESRGVKAP